MEVDKLHKHFVYHHSRMSTTSKNRTQQTAFEHSSSHGQDLNNVLIKK